jgi:putative endonuclease
MRCRLATTRLRHTQNMTGTYFYVGFTTDIAERLKHHNAGHVPATKPYRPWRIKTCLAFSDENQARAFEHYLKTQSGRAFAKKRL